MYRLLYNDKGKTFGILKNEEYFISICDGNTDYQEFLEWNAKQKVKLDINSSLKIDFEARRLAQVEAQRKSAYQAEADPLFFKAERDEIDRKLWLDKVAEIKERIK